ncbi:MAG TPA: S41 family peptidase [Blastocatellia bacterium]|nr:S41 family peptidase [Blastocatellia bacterium]
MRILSVISSLLLVGAAFAQGNNPPADKTIDATQRQEVIEGAIKKLHETYVFPEVAKQMETALRERLQRKEYDAITSATAFANKLTEHLQAVSKDKHLRVRYTGGAMPMGAPPDREQMRLMAGKRNFSFEKVERLSGNIGYLDFRGFENPEFAGETAAAAMTFLANTDALIIDLRQNGGGDPAMVAFVSSYLFDKKTHLNDLYLRAENRTEEFWTRDNVPGKKFGGEKPVYVLTAKYTFSGAEEFSYNLQTAKRATIIGEVTGGGAHPVTGQRINDDFMIGVPFARAINPITKTNWEGTGVKPDIEVPAAQALKTAHLAALKAVQAKTTDPRLTAQLQNITQTVQRELDALKAPQTTAQTTPPAESEVKLPNTPAGKTFAAFLAAFNSGRLEAMKKFHEERGGDPGNAEQDMNFYQQSGGLKLHSVKRSSDTEIEVLAQTKKSERWVNFLMTVEAQAPHSISDLRVQLGTEPGK